MNQILTNLLRRQYRLFIQSCKRFHALLFSWIAWFFVETIDTFDHLLLVRLDFRVDPRVRLFALNDSRSTEKLSLLLRAVMFPVVINKFIQLFEQQWTGTASGFLANWQTDELAYKLYMACTTRQRQWRSNQQSSNYSTAFVYIWFIYFLIMLLLLFNDLIINNQLTAFLLLSLFKFASKFERNRSARHTRDWELHSATCTLWSSYDCTLRRRCKGASTAVHFKITADN